jgi:hypothetical protein
MDFLWLTLSSLAAIAILGWLAARLYPVSGVLDEERARRNLLRYEPGADIDAVYVSSDEATAVLRLKVPEGAVGLLHRLGDRVVCRILFAPDVKQAVWTDDLLTLVFDDFTQPKLSIRFSEDDKSDVKSTFATLANTQNTEDRADAA